MWIIDTAAELSTLDEGAVIVDRNGDAWQSALTSDGLRWASRVGFGQAGDLVFLGMFGPFRVVYDPSPMTSGLTLEDVRNTLSDQRHGYEPGKGWQRAHPTGMIETTCICGEVLSISEGDFREGGSGSVWAEHRLRGAATAVLRLFDSDSP